MRPDEIVELVTDGRKYRGWKSATIARSVETLAGKFDFSLISTSPLNVALAPGQRCLVRIGNDRVINGYIDRVSFQITDAEFTLSISGRDRTGDLVDSGSELSPGTWKDISLEGYAKTLLKPFGINVQKSGIFNDKRTDHTLKIGESIFSSLDKGAKARNILLLTDSAGDLVLSTVGSAKASDSLIYGQNVLKASGQMEMTNRFAKYVVKSQKSSDGGGWTKANTEVQGTALDPEVRSTRVKVFTSETPEDSDTAKKRAGWEAIIRAAQSERFEVTVPGFRQTNRQLWKENQLVTFQLSTDMLEILSEFLISSVKYSIDENGFFSVLTLKRSDAYIPPPEQKVKKKKPRQGVKWKGLPEGI